MCSNDMTSNVPSKYNQNSMDLECVQDFRTESGRVLLYRLNSSTSTKKKELNSTVKKMVLKLLYGDDVVLKSYANGAPYLIGIEKVYVSLSHSGEYYAFYFSANPYVGIDVEIKRNINRIGADYFLSIHELKYNWSPEELLCIWGVKETYLKIKKGNLSNWKEAIRVEEVGKELIKTISNDGTLIFNRICEGDYNLIYATLPL